MRSKRYITFASPLFAGFLACAAPEPKPETQSQATQEASSTPMAPEGELEEIKTRLEEVKIRLFDEGKYNCCVQPSCDWCALHEGSCDCFPNLQAGEEVCPGCGLGWHNGQGIVDGIDPKDVKWNITHEHPSSGHQH